MNKDRINFKKFFNWNHQLLFNYFPGINIFYEKFGNIYLYLS